MKAEHHPPGGGLRRALRRALLRALLRVPRRVRDDHHRARSRGGHGAAVGAEQQGREAAAAPGAHHQHPGLGPDRPQRLGHGALQGLVAHLVRQVGGLGEDGPDPVGDRIGVLLRGRGGVEGLAAARVQLGAVGQHMGDDEARAMPERGEPGPLQGPQAVLGSVDGRDHRCVAHPSSVLGGGAVRIPGPCGARLRSGSAFGRTGVRTPRSLLPVGRENVRPFLQVAGRNPTLEPWRMLCVCRSSITRWWRTN